MAIPCCMNTRPSCRTPNLNSRYPVPLPLCDLIVSPLVRQEKRAPTAPAVLAAWGSTATTTDLSNPPTVHRTREQASSTRPSRQRKASSKAARKTASGRRGARSTATAVAGTAATAASRKGVVPYAPPFLTPGEGTSSYNVVSAVSKAVRTARRGRPREVNRVSLSAVRLRVWGLIVCCPLSLIGWAYLVEDMLPYGCYVRLWSI